MPIYTYRCPGHGDFDHTVWGVAVVGIPDTMPCPAMIPVGKSDPVHGQTRHMCRKESGRVLTLPATVIVEGGTGARRGG